MRRRHPRAMCVARRPRRPPPRAMPSSIGNQRPETMRRPPYRSQATLKHVSTSQGRAESVVCERTGARTR
jgi:hypothetical protein